MAAAETGTPTESDVVSSRSDVTYTVTNLGWRADLVDPALGCPSGAVIISPTTGPAIAFDPARKSYWRLPDQALQSSADGPLISVTAKKLDEYSTIAGVRVQKVATMFTLQMPELPDEVRDLLGAAPPIEIPGETWVAVGRFEAYAKVLSATDLEKAFEGLGLGRALAGALVMKRTTKVDAVFTESRVTEIEEVVPSPDVLEVPRGYRQLPDLAPGSRRLCPGSQ
jgi:hypothetical protein